MRVRILPVLILFAVATLGVRVGEIWHGFGGIAEARDGTAAELLPDPFADAAPQSVQLAQAGPDAEPDAAAQGARDPSAGQQASKPDAGGTGGAGGGEDVLDTADPLSMSDEEIELLQQLAARRAELDRRAERLREREATVQAAEKRLDQKVGELDRLRGEIEALLVEYDEQEAKQLDRLVEIYEKMKPKDAAKIFEDLEMEVLLKVVERMKERATAPILAEMRPNKAQELTLELAKREELPIPRE
jgi:flagellar motility protein MotE (MotC chaperone)